VVEGYVTGYSAKMHRTLVTAAADHKNVLSCDMHTLFKKTVLIREHAATSIKQRHFFLTEIVTLSITLAIALLFASCEAVYLPNVRNVPLLEKKGEVQGVAWIFRALLL